MVQLTAAHWVYALFIVVILATMMFRRETPIVCIVGAFVLALVVTGNLISSVQAVFNSITVAASELLGTVVIISVIVSMARMLEETGMAAMLFRPVRKLLRTPGISFWVMGVAIMITAWVIWPSPAIALVGALLLPAAIHAGLPPIGAAIAISMFGYGCALTTDFIIQGAPAITAKAAGVGVQDVIVRTVPMMLVWAAIALPLAYRSVRKDIRALAAAKAAVAVGTGAVAGGTGGKRGTGGSAGSSGSASPEQWSPVELSPETLAEQEKWAAAAPLFKKIALPLLGLIFALDIWAMIRFQLRGGDATALLGGSIGLIMVIIALGVYGKEGFSKLTDHVRGGFMFGIRIFSPVFLIAAFFFMGSSGTAQTIFGADARGLLFDIGQNLASLAPLAAVPIAVIQGLVGGITGLDGSGFSGLPLVGTLAQAMGGPSGLDVATLGALGQFFAIAVGGGTIIPWAVIPAAAITGSDPVEIARRNLVPAMLGFVGVIVVAVIMLMV